MKVVFLGTSAARPTSNRWLSCVVVQRKKEYFMFDCGEGTQYRLFQEKLRVWHRPLYVFISHLHYDHWGGLLGLIASMALEGRKDPLKIYGPPGIRTLYQCFSMILRKGNFPIEFLECSSGVLHETQKYRVVACEGTHNIPTLAFALIEKMRQGKFYPNRARVQKIPEGPFWGKLQKGETIQIDGRTITPDQVLGRPRPGRKLVYAVDTRPNRDIEELATNADLLIHDATFSIEQQSRAKETYHSTAHEAAKIAKKAQVRQLVLTHISARFKTDEILLREAEEVFENSRVAYDGLTLFIPPRD
ncbi:MAG: ribonuclease Z [Candidatus Hodarchaeota archaeon]